MSHFLPYVQAITVTIKNPLGATSSTSTFARVYSQILDFLFGFSIAAYILALLMGTYFLMTAGGDPKKVSIAKKIFIFSTIGFIIVVLSPGIFNFFISIFR